MKGDVKTEQSGTKKTVPAKWWVLLHAAVAIYSVNTVCAGMAGRQEPLSGAFFLWLAGEVFFLFVYALFWQQAIKRIDLSVAYANKAAGLFWALFFSVWWFRSPLTKGKVLGVVLAVAGTVLMNTDKGGAA